MGKKSKPKVEPSKKHYTQTKFLIDFDRFDQNKKGITEDFIKIMHKRCIDAAAANLGLKVIFKVVDVLNDTHTTEWKFKKFEEYIDLYSDYIEEEDMISYKDTRKQIWICPNSSIDVAFVNGAECSKGTHIKAVRGPIGHAVAEVLKKKHKIEVTYLIRHTTRRLKRN